MIKKALTLLCLFFIILNQASAAAANDTFTVETQITGDLTPPTTPSIISATPIADTQIDIVWGVVTDNAQVGGYEVFRDGVHVATTTLTSFSDTGLLGSTTYSYTVRAFDVSKNYSTTSSPVSTTTYETPPPPPPAPPAPPTDESTRVNVYLEKLEIDTTRTTAKFSWQTWGHVQFAFRWGRTTSYELGYVTTDIYKRSHQTFIDSLEPGTTYEYELIAYDRRGKAHLLSRDKFTTDEAEDVTSPANVSNLSATIVDGNVSLSWDNPTDADFDRIRVVRSPLFFPEDPYDGYLVYEGKREEFLDTNAFVFSPYEYYTVFSYDDKGNVSSGAIVWVSKNGRVSIDDAPKSTATSSVAEVADFDFSDIELWQKGKLIKPELGRYAVDGNENLTIKIPYDRLPEHLKTISVTLEHPNDPTKVFSFLLRVNRDKTSYEATIAPLGQSGVFAVTVSIFDFKTEILTQVKNTFVASYSVFKDERKMSAESVFGSGYLMVKLIVSLVLAFLLLLLLRRKNKNNKKDSAD